MDVDPANENKPMSPLERRIATACGIFAIAAISLVYQSFTQKVGTYIGRQLFEETSGDTLLADTSLIKNNQDQFFVSPDNTRVYTDTPLYSIDDSSHLPLTDSNSFK